MYFCLRTSFLWCLSIRHVCYDLYFPIFCSKIILLPSHSVVGMSSNLLPLLAARIFFRCFGVSCFVCIVRSYLGIILVFILSPEPSDSSLRVVLFVLIMFLSSFCPNIFSHFSSVLTFLLVDGAIFVFQSDFSSRFEILFVFFRRTPILSLTNFTPAWITSFNFVMLFVDMCVNNSFIF